MAYTFKCTYSVPDRKRWWADSHIFVGVRTPDWVMGVDHEVETVDTKRQPAANVELDLSWLPD